MIVSQSNFFSSIFLYVENENKICTSQKVKDDKDYERQVEQKKRLVNKEKRKSTSEKNFNHL